MSAPAFIQLPDSLKEEVQKLIRAAWHDGFDAENSGQIDFFDGFALAEESLSEPRKVCCECASRLCDGEEDEICRRCWDKSVKEANQKRIRKLNTGYILDGKWEVSSGLHEEAKP